MIDKKSGAANVRCYYSSTDAIRSQNPADVEKFLTDRNIIVEDTHSSTKWLPALQFAHIGANFPPSIMAVTSTFQIPSPIQSQCWPIVLSGRDIVGIAATGSGKTLAFLLPALVHVQHLKSSKKDAPKNRQNPLVLILSPTRELAMQSFDVAALAGKASGVRSACIYGGVSKHEQRSVLQQQGGVQIVIATPGRLQDLMMDGTISLDDISFLVLDEADRMLDMGFERDIRAIVAKLSSNRQTVMFSATWPPVIQAIANEFLKKPVKVTIGNPELAASATVKQIVQVVEPNVRDGLLLDLLSKYHSSKKNRVLVFVLYKKEAARVEEFLKRKGWPCSAIHGDMSQEARTRAFLGFKDGTIPLLIATDVAARGLDIPNVEFVINYSFPLTIEDYIHRIGRTGRAGKSGVSHTFFTLLDKAHAGELVNVLREGNHEVPADLLKFGTHVKKKEHSLYGAHFKAADTSISNEAPKKMKFDLD